MIADLPMAAGSRLLEGYLAEFDATIVTRVLDAGAEIVGKTDRGGATVAARSRSAMSWSAAICGERLRPRCAVLYGAA